MIAQVEAVTTEVLKATEGRAEIIFAGVVLMIFAALVVFALFRYMIDSRKTSLAREREEQVRCDARSNLAHKRADDAERFNHALAVKHSKQMDSFAASLDKCSSAMVMMAEMKKKTEQHLAHLTKSQKHDRSAIAAVIEAEDARQEGNNELSREALRRARNHLIRD